MNSLGSPFSAGVYQFLDDDGVPVPGGKLYSYVSGTSTPLATYADPAYASTNTNPIILTAEGCATIFLKPNNGNVGQAYDFVLKTSADAFVRNYDKQTPLAPSSSANLISAVVGFGGMESVTIAGGVITPTRQFISVTPEGGAADNLDTITTTGLPDGALLNLGNASGGILLTVRSGAGNILLSDGTNYIMQYSTERLTLIRSGSGWLEVARTPLFGTAPPGNTDACDGRLTLTSGVPVTTADVTAATTIYFAPYVGNAIDLYNSTDSTWERFTFSELSIAIPATANTLYDVFAQVSGGTVQLALSAAWSTLTTRSNALVRQNGVLVFQPNTISRYLGTFSTTGAAGQTEDSLTKRYLWNYYHRVNRPMYVRDPAGTWTYSTNTWRQANANTANQLVPVIGVSEDAMAFSLRAFLSSSVIGLSMPIGIGIDSTTVPDDTGIGFNSTSGAVNDGLSANTTLTLIPAIGRRAYTWLEYGHATAATITWYGTHHSGLSTMVRG